MYIWENSIKNCLKEIELWMWIHLTRNRDTWWAPVNAELNLQFP